MPIFEKANSRFVICDFICPTKQTRETFEPDIIIWMDTIRKGVFEDTNQIFEHPERVDFHITEWNDTNHEMIANKLLNNV